MKAALFFIVCGIGSIIYLTFSFYYLTEADSSKYPILLWWNEFISHEEVITCNNSKKCLVSGNSNLNNAQIKAILFYGSLLNLKTMPKRNPNQYWALFHEESPKNLPALRSTKLQQTFNITATFSKYSTFPITFQYLKSLDDLTSGEYFVGTQKKNKLMVEEKLAPVLYIQSACDTPIKRDSYVLELMKYVKVDSYGACLNNKKMPHELTNIESIEFYSNALMKLSAKYKFIIAIENAKCEDYVTEKFWRALIVGAVPIYMGATTIKEYLPNEKSALLVEDYLSIKALGDHIIELNNNDELYMSYLDHKLKKQVTNERLLKVYKSGGTFGQTAHYIDVIPAFQCFVCDAVHENRVVPRNFENIYDCEYPEDTSWHYSWKLGEDEADLL